MNVELNVESGAEDVFAKEIVLPCFLDGALEDFRALREFSADVDVRRVRVKRITRDQHSFEQLVRVFVNDVAVFECPRLGFVGVADQIYRPLFVRLDEAPFEAAGKAGPAAAAESRVFNFVDNVGARKSQRLPYLLVTAVAQVTIDVARPTRAPDI